MNITNKNNLPTSFVRAVMNDPYDPGESDITITSLIDSPQVRLLFKKHKEHITEDASDRLWSLFGSACHHILEQADREHPLAVLPEAAALLRGAGFNITNQQLAELLHGHIPTEALSMPFKEQVMTETRLYLSVLGWKAGAKFDRITLADPFVMQDYKCTSVWTLIFGDRLIEWEKQLNLQAHVARANNLRVDSLEIVALLRDWRPGEVAKYTDYPQGPVAVLPMPVWSPEKCQSFMEERVKIHQAAEASGEASCTDAERWFNAKKKTFARCAQYCPVARFCPQLEAEKA